MACDTPNAGSTANPSRVTDKRAGKEDRLAQALRSNLRRRKTQATARKDIGVDGRTTPTTPQSDKGET